MEMIILTIFGLFMGILIPPFLFKFYIKDYVDKLVNEKIDKNNINNDIKLEKMKKSIDKVRDDFIKTSDNQSGIISEWLNGKVN